MFRGRGRGDDFAGTSENTPKHAAAQVFACPNFHPVGLEPVGELKSGWMLSFAQNTSPSKCNGTPSFFCLDVTLLILFSGFYIQTIIYEFDIFPFFFFLFASPLFFTNLFGLTFFFFLVET